MYLLTQILLFLLLAAAVGFLAGWFSGRCRCEADEVREKFAAAETSWRRENAELKAKIGLTGAGGGEAATLANVNAMAAMLAAKLESAEAARAALEAERNAALREAEGLRQKLAAAPAVDANAAAPADWQTRLAAAEKARSAALQDADALRQKLAAAPDAVKLKADWQARLAAAERDRDAARTRLTALESERSDVDKGWQARLTSAQDVRDGLQRRIDDLEADIARLRAGGGSAIGLMGAGAVPAVSNANFKPSSLAALDVAELEAAVLAAGDGVRPSALPTALGLADDLKEIGGVGPALEAWLNEHGIFHFWQIAVMEAPQLAWLANNLPHFGSRVYREHWIEQAIQLARGEMTDAKKKYQEGKQT
jgi:predicted flap endonuclease-1-like 5' DNA nuclease